MKKILLSTGLMLFLTLNIFGQKKSIGFTGGLTISNYHAKVDGETDDGKSKLGFTLGVLADIPLSKNFSFQPALNFVQKGTKEEFDLGGGDDGTIKLSNNSIEIPLNFIYKSGGAACNFFIGAGPSLSLSVAGKIKYDDGTDDFSQDLDFGNSEDDDMRGFDIGANVLAGVECKNGLLVALNYNQGLSNLYPQATDNDKLSSHYFGIRIGYILKMKKQ